MRRTWPALAFVVALSGCATLQQLVALRDVDFDIDRLSDVRLAGVDLSNVR